MSDSPAAVLFDSDGNPVAVVADGSLYALKTASKIKFTNGDDTDYEAAHRFASFDEADVKRLVVSDIDAKQLLILIHEELKLCRQILQIGLGADLGDGSTEN